MHTTLFYAYVHRCMTFIVLSGFLSQGPVFPQMLQMTTSDSVFSCAVLCDGFLLLELCDAIHEGDGRPFLGLFVVRSLYFMLFYFKAYNYHKYALEAFLLLALINGAASPLVKQQILWSRTFNSRGGQGNTYWQTCTMST